MFVEEWNRADRFVLQHVVGGEARDGVTVDTFVRQAAPGDYLLLERQAGHGPELVAIRANRRPHLLCRRRD